MAKETIKCHSSKFDECTNAEEEEKFTGHSCLLVTWKTNPEVEKLKVKCENDQT